MLYRFPEDVSICNIISMSHNHPPAALRERENGSRGAVFSEQIAFSISATLAGEVVKK
jgi:hypothetical protein